MAMPEGMQNLFSRMYMERGEPSSDSKKARVRLGAYFDSYQYSMTREIGEFLRIHGGIACPLSTTFERFFESAPFVDILDSVTLLYSYLKEKERINDYAYSDHGSAEVPEFVRQVLAQENLRYRIDADGIVHPLIDQEFADSASNLLRGLDKDAAIQKEVDHCYAEMAKLRPRYKTAVRAIFEAIEILTKRMTSSTRLDGATVRGELATIVIAKLGADPASLAGACRPLALVWLFRAMLVRSRCA